MTVRSCTQAALWLAIYLAFSPLSSSASRQAGQKPAAPVAVVRSIGTIQSIHGNTIALKSDTGTELNILVQESARLLRTAPGQQDLKDASPITLQDLQAGDRVLVRGKIADDGKSVMASSVIAIKRTDIAEKQKRELQDWQRRGIGGIVKSVDASAGTVSISVLGASGATTVAVKSSKDTVIRRYSPDSVKFDDAVSSSLDQVKAGDQLRARGTRNADGMELAAEEIVSGSFRNIAGLVTAVDPDAQTITVSDLATKKPVTVHIASNSEMYKLPPMIAQRIAMRLKGLPAEVGGGGNAPSGANGAAPAAPGGPAETHAQGAASPNGGQRGGDLQQILSRMPQMAFADCTKGEAVMIVTTSGTATTNATAITLLSGVEAILTASPNGSGAASLLTPWSLGNGGADPTAQ